MLWTFVNRCPPRLPRIWLAFMDTITTSTLTLYASLSIIFSSPCFPSSSSLPFSFNPSNYEMLFFLSLNHISWQKLISFLTIDKYTLLICQTIPNKKTGIFLCLSVMDIILCSYPRAICTTTLTLRLSCCFLTCSRLSPGLPWAPISASISSSQADTSSWFSP